MTDYNMNSMMTNREMAVAVIAAPFQALARGFRSLMLQGPRVSALNTLSQYSDAELAARGLTRSDIALQILRNPG